MEQSSATWGCGISLVVAVAAVGFIYNHVGTLNCPEPAIAGRFVVWHALFIDILCGGIRLRRNALALLLSRSPKGVPMGDFFEGGPLFLSECTFLFIECTFSRFVVKQVPKGSA